MDKKVSRQCHAHTNAKGIRIKNNISPSRRWGNLIQIVSLLK